MNIKLYWNKYIYECMIYPNITSITHECNENNYKISTEISNYFKILNMNEEDYEYIEDYCLNPPDKDCITIPYENKELLIKLIIIDYIYNNNFEETEHFIKGFHSVIEPNLLTKISNKDLNLLIAGNNEIDINLFLDNIIFENAGDKLDSIKNIITEYAIEDPTYLNEFFF